MAISTALQTAISGLRLNQSALDVTAQNVANVNTDGYSRKIVNQESVVVVDRGGGVSIASIERRVNEFMLKDLRTQISASNDYEQRNSFYDRMQDLFGAPGSDTSIGYSIGDLASKIQALAVNPENASLMSDITSRAELITARFNQLVTQIESLRQEADSNIETAVAAVNIQLERVQELNLRIAANMALGHGVSELRDQRDLAMNEIAEYMDINYFERTNGEYVIFTDSGRPLLDRTADTLTHDAASAFDASITWASGAINTIDLNGADITSEISSGAIAGWIALRDSILPDLHSQFEELAQSFAFQINAIHNDGVGYPGLAVMTGSHEIAGADTPIWSGDVRIAVVDTSGVVQEFQDFDLSTYADIDALVTAIGGMATVTASINANGNVVIDALGANRLAINEMDSAVTVGSQTMGLSQFFGLNDMVTHANNYDIYTSSQQPSTATALATGNITFSGSFGSTAVTVTAGDDIATIAASINADGTLAAANISASVIADGTGFPLRIVDSDADSFFIADAGTLVSSMSIKAREHGVASSIAVRSDIIADPSRLSRGELSASGTLAVGDTGVTAGSQAVVQRLANMFDTALTFDEMGELPDMSKTLANYATAILSLNATQSRNVADSWATKTFLHENLKEKTRAISSVNLDEEMAHMIVLQNAYSASARIITTASELIDELMNMAR